MTGGRWLVIAASTREAAERFVGRHGLDTVEVLTGPELLAMRWRLRSAVSGLGADALLLHSADWRRQTFPQAYLAAVASAPVADRRLADETRGRWLRLSGAVLARSLAAAPIELIGGAVRGGSEVRLHFRDLRADSTGMARGLGSRGGVLAVWLGETGTRVGGSISHIAGILGGFRRLGLRVALLTLADPPAQLAAVADEVEAVPPLPRGERATTDLYRLTSNRHLRAAGADLARRVGASLVYERHEAMLVAGLQVARAAALPFVLEWNSSEVWTRRNWGSGPRPFGAAFDRLTVSMETWVASGADLVAAVSAPAADMALAAGAVPDRVLVVPNAVDAEQVRPVRRRAKADESRAVLGWVGSFGPWHGAEVLVRAMALLPADVHAVMVGDGAGRRSCEDLAASLGVGGRIEWTGSVPHDEAVRRLAACDVLVSPHVPIPGTRFFGSPTKVFEYMALGRPIVASRLEQIAEILKDGRTARLVDPGDPGDLARGIADVLADPDRARTLGRNARREAKRHHTWDTRAAAILETLERRPAGALGPPLLVEGT